MPRDCESEGKLTFVAFSCENITQLLTPAALTGAAFLKVISFNQLLSSKTNVISWIMFCAGTSAQILTINELFASDMTLGRTNSFTNNDALQLEQRSNKRPE
jgi:hypothetical protein